MLLFMWITLFLHYVDAENLTLLTQTRTGYLEQYTSYVDVSLMLFNIPSNAIFASFQFRANEISNSLFSCKPKEVVLYLKHGSPPVINPDGSKFPSSFYWNGRPKSKKLVFMSNKIYSYINMTYPITGSYFGAVSYSYTNPKDAAITQDGLLPVCHTYVDASVYIRTEETMKSIMFNTDIKMAIKQNATSVFKLHIPENVGEIGLNLNDIKFCESCDKLICKLYPSGVELFPNSTSLFTVTKAANRKSVSALYKVVEKSKYILEFSISNTEINSDILGKFILNMKIFNNIDDTVVYYKNTTEILFLNALNKVHNDNSYLKGMPYKQYNLHKSVSFESFLYTYEMQPLGDGSVPIAVNITSNGFSVIKFSVGDYLDIGGSLLIILAFKPRVTKLGNVYQRSKAPENQTIVACIHNGRKEIPSWENSCKYQNNFTASPLVLNSTHENESFLIPYPEPGDWYLSFKLFCGHCEPCNCPKLCTELYMNCVSQCQMECSDLDCANCTRTCEIVVLEKEECKSCDCDGNCRRTKNFCNNTVLFDVSSYPCVSYGCSANGKCVFLVSEGFVYSSCVCVNNYRGWDCSDDSLANSMGTVLLELLLLVLSNLAFLPATYIAYKRTYYIEMVTYMSTCVFSIFYHSCDAGENIFSFCIVPLYVLQFCDFYSALLSIWVTLIAIAHLREPLPPVLHILAAILLGAGTTLDKTSIWVFLLPVTVGVLVIIVNWGWNYIRHKTLLPNINYLKYTLPLGLVIVTIGLIFYSLLQTQSNYKYIHSLWHILMAVAVMILLPSKNTFPPNTVPL